MADMVTKQELEAAKVDVKNAGEAVNEEKVVKTRLGRSFKSIPLIVKEGEAKITQAAQTITSATASIVSQKNQAAQTISQAESDVVTAATDVHQRGNQEIINLQNAIDIAAAAGAGENGWTAQLIVDENGKTQQEINDNQKERTLNLIDFFTPEEYVSFKSDYGSVDIKDALDRAVFAASHLGLKLNAYGKFRTAQTCHVYCDADLSCATLEYEYPSGICLVIGNMNGDTLTNKDVKAFKVANTVKLSGDNWVSTTAIGIRTLNLDSCNIYIPFVSSFAIGFQEYGAAGKGNCYSTITLGKLFNNKINHQIDTDGSSAWVNENIHIGGRYQHLNAEGTDIAGCIHIDIKPTNYTINNNVWHKPSLEGQATEFNVSNGGSWNSILQARWETSPPKVRYICETGSESAANQGTNNIISGGYFVDNVQITTDGTGSTFRNQLRGVSREISHISSSTGGKRFKNGSSDSAAVLTIFSAATNINTATLSERCVSFSANGIGFKRSTDEFDRININGNTGRIEFGTGASSSDVFLASLSGVLRVSARYLNPFSIDTTSLGQATTRYTSVYSAKYMFSATVGVFCGDGSPEGFLAAGVGSTYQRLDGVLNMTFYVKETGTGNTGWVAK